MGIPTVGSPFPASSHEKDDDGRVPPARLASDALVALAFAVGAVAAAPWALLGPSRFFGPRSEARR